MTYREEADEVYRRWGLGAVVLRFFNCLNGCRYKIGKAENGAFIVWGEGDTFEEALRAAEATR